jgi:WD40 repeat protein
MRRLRRRQPVTPVQTGKAAGPIAGPQPADNYRKMLGLKLLQSFTGMEKRRLYAIAWSADGATLAATGEDGHVGLWTQATGEWRIWPGHTGTPVGLAWHPVSPLLATAANDKTVRLWQTETEQSSVLCRLASEITGVAWSPDGRQLAVYALDGLIAIYDTKDRTMLRSARPYARGGYGLCWSRDGSVLVAGSESGDIIVCSGEDLEFIRKLKGHTGGPSDVALAPKGNVIASAGFDDRTVRIWNSASGQEITILEGHRSGLTCVRFSPDGEFLASLSADELRLWRCRDWECVSTVSRIDAYGAGGLDFHPSQPFLAAKGIDPGNGAQQVDCFKIDYTLLGRVDLMPDSSRYVNAKVILLGDTGVGKSGLGLVLSGQSYEPTDSTHGRNVWTLDAQEVLTPAGGTQTREILLWDLAGQPGYRLIHQLHLGEVAVALLVFDARSETDPFSGVKHWVRALAQARRLEGSSAVPLRAYLVAARADRGGVAVTTERVEAMLKDLDLDGFFETSAKEGWQVADLVRAVRDGIVWDALPMVSSTLLFGSIKEFLLAEKEQGRLLSTVDDLFRGFKLAQPDAARDAHLRASFETCIGRVESRGLIRRLHFGDLVLLQPELLDAYASAMVQAAKEEPDGLGFIPEENALEARFRLPDQERVRDPGQEKLLLIATVEELLRHEIALKATTDREVDLVFPSQFTRERPDAPDVLDKQAVFTFEGPLYSIYATLAVRLSHSTLFRRQAMWQNAASYISTAGGTCGIHLREVEEGRGELALFFDKQAGQAARAQFETYVSEHLEQRALPGTLTRRQIRACPNCEFVLPEDLIQRRLKLGATTIRCPACEEAIIPLAEEPIALPEAAVSEMNRSADERRDRNVAEARLRGKMETKDYDVFLCYNSRDRERVMALGEQLKELGILPWLDVWELRPGTRWQQELEEQIKSIKSAAVFIGPRGPGPWQEFEVESLLVQLAKRKCPIIPVILEGRQGQPQLPPLLNVLHLVDMRQPDPDPFRQLVWGITGEKSPGEF